MILALDTSGGELIVCLLGDDLALVAQWVSPGRQHQEVLLDAIQGVLGDHRAAASLAAIAVVRGPGSQTGLRVGMAAAEGIAYASRLPILPLSSLAVAAARLPGDGGRLAAVSAGRSNVYAQLHRGVAGDLHPHGPRVLGAAETVRATLGLDASVPVAAEPALYEAFRHAVPADAVPGSEALAHVVREAHRGGVQVAYHQLTGDYGE